MNDKTTHLSFFYKHIIISEGRDRISQNRYFYLN